MVKELAAANAELKECEAALAGAIAPLDAAALDREAARAARLQVKAAERCRTAAARSVKLAAARVRKAELAEEESRRLEALLASVSSGFELYSEPTAAWVKLAESTQCLRAEPPGERTPGTLRCVCISDTHGQHEQVVLPPGDVLLHAGDITETGELEQIRSFCQWLDRQPFKHKVVVAGNHDVLLDRPYYEREGYERFHKRLGAPHDGAEAERLLRSCCVYLENEAAEIEGLRFYGSPCQPSFMSWAFGLERGPAISECWRRVPEATDVLLVHGPPVGFGDLTFRGERAGCVDLLREVQTRVRPRYVVYGHIHEGYGAWTDGSTTYLNAASCGRNSAEGLYVIEHQPLVFDIHPRGGDRGETA